MTTKHIFFWKYATQNPTGYHHVPPKNVLLWGIPFQTHPGQYVCPMFFLCFSYSFAATTLFIHQLPSGTHGNGKSITHWWFSQLETSVYWVVFGPHLMTPEGKSNPISPKIPTVDGRSHEISIQSPFFMIKSRSISIFHHTISWNHHFSSQNPMTSPFFMVNQIGSPWNTTAPPISLAESLANSPSSCVRCHRASPQKMRSHGADGAAGGPGAPWNLGNWGSFNGFIYIYITHTLSWIDIKRYN